MGASATGYRKSNISVKRETIMTASAMVVRMRNEVKRKLLNLQSILLHAPGEAHAVLHEPREHFPAGRQRGDRQGEAHGLGHR
jgi:hypothetical protein